MLRRAQTTTVVERVTILERATAGETDSMIAAALGCSIWTVRKWRRRGQQRGRSGLAPALGRPAKALLSTIPLALRETILTLRRAHPGRIADRSRVVRAATPQPLAPRLGHSSRLIECICTPLLDVAASIEW